MAKKKKTKKQKISADLRRHQYTADAEKTHAAPVNNEPMTPSRTVTYSAPQQSPKVLSRGATYDHLATFLPGDLQKTALVTATILATECILFFLMRNTL